MVIINGRQGTPSVGAIKHRDKRVNVPTEELRDFVADEELTPSTMLYPRDPSLDPQLVWKGKDEQDREDLAVPVVPIYIQEKIHPQAIIMTCSRRRHANRAAASRKRLRRISLDSLPISTAARKSLTRGSSSTSTSRTGPTG